MSLRALIRTGEGRICTSEEEKRVKSVLSGPDCRPRAHLAMLQNNLSKHKIITEFIPISRQLSNLRIPIPAHSVQQH